jgi:hypothetical protein
MMTRKLLSIRRMSEPPSDLDTTSDPLASVPIDARKPTPQELGFDAPAPKRKYESIGEAASDIVQLVKPRADWWESGPLSSPVSPLAETSKDDPLDAFILALPLPAYGLLGIAGVVAIAFVGCIFQLFYDVPAAPVRYFRWAAFILS